MCAIRHLMNILHAGRAWPACWRQPNSTGHFHHSHLLPPMAARTVAKMAARLAAHTARASAAGLRSNSVLFVHRQRFSGLAAIAHRSFGGTAHQPLHLRSFSASASVAATDVAAIVSEELKYEQENYTKPVISLWQSTRLMYALYKFVGRIICAPSANCEPTSVQCRGPRSSWIDRISVCPYTWVEGCSGQRCT